MGIEPPCPLSSQNCKQFLTHPPAIGATLTRQTGRPITHTIPITQLPHSTPSPCLHLQTRNVHLRPPRRLPPPLLAHNPRLHRLRRPMGNTPAALPPHPRPRLPPPHPRRRRKVRPLPLPHHTAPHQHRRDRRGRRRQIRRYPGRGRADILRQDPRRPVRVAVHVLLVKAQLHGAA